MTEPALKFRFAIDRGGTFTDVFAEVQVYGSLWISARFVCLHLSTWSLIMLTCWLYVASEAGHLLTFRLFRKMALTTAA
jgi:hypothetical protein